MPDYNESSVAGQKWQRAGYIAINNPRPQEGLPSITFVEEERIALGDGRELTEKLGNLVEAFTPENYLEQFDLLDPETGAVIGQATYMQVYVMLASAYRHVANKRDAALAPLPIAPET